MRQAASGRAVRALSVLAVLVGLLAMHGIASNEHHSAVAASTLAGALPSTGGADAGHAHAAAAEPAAAVQAGACDPACSDGDSGLLLLCVAVLLASGAVLLLRLRPRAGPRPRRAGPPLRISARAPAPPRSFDVVAEFCVSRT